MTIDDYASERRTALFAAILVLGPCLNACSGTRTTDAGSDTRIDDTSADDANSETGGPDGSVPDATSVDVSATDATDATDAPVAPTHTCPASLPRFDLRTDFHAVGDGMADDTDALHDAAVAIAAAGGGELVIPPGTYRIGRQAMGAMAGMPFYRPAPMFSVDGASCLQISGYGATLHLASRLHYGAFDETTGMPVPGPTTDPLKRGDVGRMIEVTNSANVLVEGLELDGNNTALSLGGQWGDVDRQTSATGISLNRDTDVHVRDIHTHHHGLDGITVAYRGGRVPSRMPHLLERVNSEYNGRQGISWIGGWGLEAVDCQFNHTGRAINQGGGVDDGMPLVSRPRAGLDIEPNNGTTEISREGQFTRCEFVDNAGAQLTAAVGDGGYSTFTDCTFWGTTAQSAWANRPGLRFVNSRFYGTLVHPSDGRATSMDAPVPSLAAVFEGCTFEDRPWTDGRVFRSGNLVTIGPGEGSGVTWRNCTFINHEVRAVGDADAGTTEIYEGCTFRFDNNTISAGARQTTFESSRVTSTHFTETASITHDYDIVHTGAVVGTPAAGAPDTVVDGPHVTWGGRTGVIPPGP